MVDSSFGKLGEESRRKELRHKLEHCLKKENMRSIVHPEGWIIEEIKFATWIFDNSLKEHQLFIVAQARPKTPQNIDFDNTQVVLGWIWNVRGGKIEEKEENIFFLKEGISNQNFINLVGEYKGSHFKAFVEHLVTKGAPNIPKRCDFEEMKIQDSKAVNLTPGAYKDYIVLLVSSQTSSTTKMKITTPTKPILRICKFLRTEEKNYFVVIKEVFFSPNKKQQSNLRLIKIEESEESDLDLYFTWYNSFKEDSSDFGENELLHLKF